ncbi:hypothetical protein CXG81DRAFT_19102 [Caulochytrium protostelioides]|uniref:Uncharacterized protein n=1 Tax=Caulochytrium protostelioides TaxID=1555241 RepID=A0A4P9X773_9FUNG|nr:hypothetical protein CXG81DRAFT_19102 [Caulochytrium protostelioides]|eukprot:RKP01058.1 hypothetical protein CXG81DRAFT_19102 [Caulochytrium protostelioides]
MHRGHDDSVSLQQLEMLRGKFGHLADSLNAFLGQHPLAPWPSILIEANLLTAKTASLLKELDGMAHALSATALVPDPPLPPHDPDFLPRVLLRSKAPPEVEKNEQQCRDIADAAAPFPAGTADRLSPSRPMPSDDPYEAHEAHWQQSLEAYAGVVDAAIESFDQACDDFELKTRLPALPSQIAQESRSGEAAMNRVRGAGGAGSGTRQTRTPLEATMAWIASGVEPIYQEAATPRRPHAGKAAR